MISDATTSHVHPFPVTMITAVELARMDAEDFERWYADKALCPELFDSGLGEGEFSVTDDTTVAKDALDWFEGALHALGELLSLPPNWDGYGSPAPLLQIVSCAENVLRRLRDVVPANLPRPFVCPVSGGGLQFEWTTDTKHLELEFVSQSEALFLTEDLTRPDAEDAMDAGELNMVEGLAKLREKLLWFTS